MRMGKKNFLNSLIYGSKAVALCVTFTVATLLDMLLSFAQGITDISYAHLAIRFIPCVLIVLSLYIFKCFEKLPLYLMLVIHFAITLLIMLGSAWITGLFSELHSDAYYDAIRSVVITYPVIIITSIIADTIRTAKANRILRNRLSENHDKK